MKLLHISDLHICSRETQPFVERFRGAVRGRASCDLDIHTADPVVLEALRRLIACMDPDILIVSGDITTLGDSASFTEAATWITAQLNRPGEARHCLVVPGNHDLLLGQLLGLATKRRMPWYLWIPATFYFHDAIGVVKELGKKERKDLMEHPLANFLEFARTAGLSQETRALDLGESSKVQLYPFWSISTDPVWMNLGTARDAERDRMMHEIERRPPEGEGWLRIVVMHHNPIASSHGVETEMTNAYNSMPAGPQFMSQLQSAGVDVLLHGHQHKTARLLYDFDFQEAGHAYAIGCASSTARNGSCNLIEVSDVNHATVMCYRFDEQNARFTPEGRLPWNLCFERNRPTDERTQTTRYELKRYGRKERDEADYMSIAQSLSLPGTPMVYLSGRHLEAMHRANWDELKALLSSGTYVRVLLSDPEVLRKVAGGADLERGGGSPDLWGATEQLSGLADTAERSVRTLTDFVQSHLDGSECKRLDVRVAHTILPFGAVVRDADKKWGKMLVRILPVGAFGAIGTPFLKLNRRANELLYDHYLGYLTHLIRKGRHILGAWDRGDADLEAVVRSEIGGSVAGKTSEA